MKTRGLLIAIGILTLAGCATRDQRLPDSTAVPAAATQQEAAQQARDYRTQAQALRDMAERRQVEADLLSRELGPDDPGVQKKRRLAQELRDAADETENKARDLRGQVPHGMMQ